MIDSNEYKDQENKESDTALVPSELHILVTDADTNGYEISKMSDFMGLYAQQLTRSLADRFDWLLICISKFFSCVTVTGERVL